MNDISLALIVRKDSLAGSLSGLGQFFFPIQGKKTGLIQTVFLII